MRRRRALGVVAATVTGGLLALPGVVGPGPSGAGIATTGFLTAPDLSPAAEIPPVSSTASGFAGVYLDAVAGVACTALELDGIEDHDVQVAHIHAGAAGVEGPPVFTLPSPHHATHGLSGCALIDTTLAAQILADPEGYYVNVHTVAEPDGEVRGQLSDPPDDPGTTFTPELLGTNEEPVTDGDLEAGVEISVNADGLVCFSFDYGNVDDDDVVAADHLHRGEAGTSGDMLVDLGHDFFGGEGCVVGVRSKMAAVLADPVNHYVRVHTITWPDGAVRGQLAEPAAATTTTTTAEAPGSDGGGGGTTTTAPAATPAQPVAGRPTFAG